MPIAARVESVTNLAEILITPGAEATSTTPAKFTVANRHATVSLWIGGPTVNDSTTGFEVKPGEAFDISLFQGDVLYGYAPSVNANIHILQRIR